MTKNPRQISLIGSRATSVLSIALVLVIIGICGTLVMALNRASDSLADETTILITLRPGCDSYTATELKRDFKNSTWVSDFEYADATTVLSREVQAMDTITRQGLALLSGNPFGDEFIIRLAPGYRSTDSISAISGRLRALPDVDIVSSEATAMGRVNDSLSRIFIYGGILVLILLIISVVLISNTISLSIYSRRFNIHTMKLVGATDAFIRRPFVRAGMLTGIVAGLIASVVVCAAQCYLLWRDSLIGPWITPLQIGITAVVLIVLGAVIARAAAWVAATNYLKKSYNELFRK